MRTFLAILICGLLLLTACRTQDTTHPYLVLYAFDAEGKLLSEQMQTDTTMTILGRTVREGRLVGKEIVLAESGIGMTNAAMSTQALIDRFHPVAVIMTGIAGSVDTSVSVGDIVVCSLWVQHDYLYVGNNETRHSNIPAYVPDKNSVLAVESFPVDTTLLEAARSINTGDLALLDIDGRVPRLIVGGVGVSGNGFIDSKSKRLQLSSDFHALVTDMESCAVAQVCQANSVPVIVLRSASDLAGGSGEVSANDQLERFFSIAADNSATILEALLAAI